MSGNIARLNAIAAAIDYELTSHIESSVTEMHNQYGINVFNDKAMQDYLPKDVYKSLKATIEEGKNINKSNADIIANGLKDWATEKGASHYSHIFYPLTGGTAEKHDAFFQPDGLGKNLFELTGRLLCQGEPDASSFPNGDIRQTSQARGYTIWDASSPAYIVETSNSSTLFIPSLFISWKGEALDTKTPLLRSEKALDKQAHRLLELLGNDNITKIVSFAGPEQEYFLIDTAFYTSRPDLMAADRTVFGAQPPKGQEFDDHYFGIIPERVIDFMSDIEEQFYKLAIPAKTRHNEVAPGQFEIAPVYETANLAADHQHIIMTTIKATAKRHGMTALFHEKPFAGLNGSGKHLNWSCGNSTQGNFLNPGKNPHTNTQFLIFCTAVIRAISKNQGILRTSIASVSNDHRLGANEAPPAIISIFLGEQLEDIFRQIKEGKVTSSLKGGEICLNLSTVPSIEKDAGDRNRTSPFAFTGNRFEFRAVGSLQPISIPLTILNTTLADSLDYIVNQIEEFGLKSLNKILQNIVQEESSIIFSGNGYSDAWHKEAITKRGLKNLCTTPEAIPEMNSKEIISLFKKHNVLSKIELDSRRKIATEQYIMKINVESNLVLTMGYTFILPPSLRYQTELADNVATLNTVGIEADTSLLQKISTLIKNLQFNLKKLKKAKMKEFKDLQKEAEYFCKTILPLMLDIRSIVDKLEVLIADDLWVLPTYQEMLFIK